MTGAIPSIRSTCITMDSLPDRFLFVNKFANSPSLSHSNREEEFFIHSHVHGKYYKQKRQTRQRYQQSEPLVSSNRPSSLSDSKAFRTPNQSEVTSTSTSARLIAKHKHPKETVPHIQKDSQSNMYSSALHNVIDAVAIDPFYCTASTIDAKDQRLLYYPFTSFIETTFNAESLSWMASSTAFRHREAIVERLRHCVDDELTLYSTLAYCASCMRWAVGEKERERPPEFYMLKAIKALKIRLEKADVIDKWLILSIYALAVSEMWGQNYEAAIAHLKMARHLVTRIGGLMKLDAYMMESILLCDKYVAVGRFEAPIFGLDWEPGSLPTQEMPKVQTAVDPALSELAQGFYDPESHLLGSHILQIIGDIRDCVQASQQSVQGNALAQHWLFLRHQAIFRRLLSLQTTGETQHCCRIALIVWLLKITVYFGALRWSKRLLPNFKAAILRLEHTDDGRCPAVLMFWMTSLGAMTAEYTDERDWFLKRTVHTARSLGIQVDKEHFRTVLRKFLFLNCEDGLQFFRMVRAAQEMQDHTRT